VLWLTVATNNILYLQFNPRQKLNLILVTIPANSCEFR
jgi:hypothetical protein